MTLTTTPAAPPTALTPPGRRGWTAWRIVSLVLGLLLGLFSLGLLGAGGVAAWATNTQRDSSGYLTTDVRTFTTRTFAVTSEGIDLTGFTGAFTPADAFGTVRIRAEAVDPARAVFIGITTQSAADTYLAGADHVVVSDWAGDRTRLVGGGEQQPGAPADASIWAAHVSGTGRQSLTWRPTSGHWVVVVMNTDASPGVSVTADAGATVPDLGWLATGLLIAGGVFLVLAGVAVTVPIVRASRS